MGIIIITCDNALLKLINLLITYFATCKEEDAKTTRQLIMMALLHIGLFLHTIYIDLILSFFEALFYLPKNQQVVILKKLIFPNSPFDFK